MAKRRKMTEEQKAAAVERLAAARAKRLAANPPTYANIADSVLALDDEHGLSFKNVKQYIKTQKELLAAEKRNLRSNTKGSQAKVSSIEGYIRTLNNYLATGTFNGLFWGEYEQNPITTVCTHMAYDKDGLVKRTKGVWYPDIGGVYEG
jgi:hypothetical protein